MQHSLNGVKTNVIGKHVDQTIVKHMCLKGATTSYKRNEFEALDLRSIAE